MISRRITPRRKGRGLFTAIAATGLLGSLLFASGTALAVHDTGTFQLDGNAEKSNTTGAIDADPAAGTDYGDDWDNVCAEVAGSATALATCSTTVETDGATAVSWVSEPDRSTSIFTGGGSKDPSDLPNWLWKNAGGLPDKDNLRHAFAARYTDANSDEVLYFGSDRFDNSGDAQQGFWFLQAPLKDDGAKSGGGNLFTDGSGGAPAHTVGDLLVISDFSNGGAISTINIYSWVASGGDTTTHLDFVDGGDGVKCLPSLSGDNFCGIVNPGPGLTNSPWAFLDKSNNADFANGELYEAGINLTGLNFGSECFSTVVAETRSSTSPTATLKDFVVGQFGNCVATLATQVSDAGPVLPGAAVHDTLTVSSSDTTHTASGDVEWFLCGPIATGACDSGGTDLGSSTLGGSGGVATTDSPDVNDTGSELDAGRYCFRAEWPGDVNFTAGPYSEFGGTGGTNECFSVKDTSTIGTTQNWLPNDSAHVTTGSGAAASGTVTFTLYEGGDCTGTVITTFDDVALDASGDASTDNTTFAIAVSTGETISWGATFTPSDPDAVGGSSSNCETSTVTIDDDITD